MSIIKTKIKRELISRAEYARRRGVAPRTIGKYVQRKILPTHDDKIDPVECDRLLKDYLVRPLGADKIKVTKVKATKRKPDPVDGDGEKLTYVEARTQEKTLKVELLELDLALKKGEMVLVKDVEFAAFTASREVRDKMLNIPDQVAAIVAAEMDELKVRELIMSAIESGLTGVAEAYDRHRSLIDGNAK